MRSLGCFLLRRCADVQRAIFTHHPLYQQLLVYDPAKALPVSSFPLSILPEAHPSINCFQALDYLCVFLSFMLQWNLLNVFLAKLAELTSFS